MHELERILQRQIEGFASGILGHPERSALDRSAEAVVRARLGGHEHMFSCQSQEAAQAGRGAVFSTP